MIKNYAFLFSLFFLFTNAFSQVTAVATWISGDNIGNRLGIYGSKGVASPANIPGAREGAVSWTDPSGNLWLMGGYGFPTGSSAGLLNDLWKYNPSSGLWTWISGDSISNRLGVYGIKGMADPANKPGARRGAVSWTDASGNLWIMGGSGLNDLWKFNPSTGLWTWVSGDNSPYQQGVYGVKGVTDAANKPGGREGGAVSWIDASGNLWLMGGVGYSTGFGVLNDLWKYNPSTGLWTWMSGDSTIYPPGVYGIKGVADPVNKPGGRDNAVGWTDASGNLWLMGGSSLNDLWKYDQSTGFWTWMSGDKSSGQPGVYGIKGVANSTNKPGGRYDAVSWTDTAGNMWLMGGFSDAFRVPNILNDLWEYNPSTGLWTWVSGDNFYNSGGSYGTKGVADPANNPPGKASAVSWRDAFGNFWLMGGNYRAGSYYLNDLWKYEISTNQDKTYYKDADGDRYGNPKDTIRTITQTPPSGYVADNADCDDNNPDVHPGTVEICGNGIDDNCNGQIDEGCSMKSSGINYKYYEGNFNTLPDFTSLTPVKTGVTPNVDISVRTPGRDDNFAFLWEGYIKITTPGNYTFETISDDGSKLYFNSLYFPGASALVNDDGIHPVKSATGNVNIPTAGVYPIAFSFFEKEGDQIMQLYWTGPGITRQLIPDTAFVPSPTSSAGLNYKYYEGNFDQLPDFTTLTPIKTGISANADLSVRQAGVNDHFAFVWEGLINIPSAGDYTFETISDDGSKLYFNGSLLVNNDGVHALTSVSGKVTIPVAGSYPVTISFFEKDGDEKMQLYWSGPGFARQPVPDSVFSQRAVTPSLNAGLNYKYYEGNFDQLPDFSTLTPVKTGISANADISIRPIGVNDRFAFVWTGTISIPSAGIYTFETISDDGSRLYFNRNLLVNNDGVHPLQSASGTVTIPAAGNYTVTISFFEKDGDQNMQLYWSGPGFTRQSIPDVVFSRAASAAANVVVNVRGKAFNDANEPGKETLQVSAMPKVYPNPFNQGFTMDYFNSSNNKHKISIGLYDLNGKLLYNYQPSGLLPGYNRWQVSLGNTRLAKGIYVVRLTIDGVPAMTTKLVKIK